MNTQIIYEATNNIHPFTFPFIIICIVLILVIVYIVKNWKNYGGPFIGKILFLLVPIGLSMKKIIKLVLGQRVTIRTDSLLAVMNLLYTKIIMHLTLVIACVTLTAVNYRKVNMSE